MNLSEDLAWRGLIKDKTFENVNWLDKPQTFYHGIDASADSMTIGNLAPMLLARRFIESGWNAVLLVGGATSLIGDPGGKSEERDLIKREDIKRNIDAIQVQISQLFANKNYTLVDNYQWFSKIGYLNFLREYGKRFSMTELMQREFVTERMGEGGAGISYAEFSYGLVQGYDFYHLNNEKVKVENEDKILGAVLQIGGSDQWSNMLVGVSMIRKKTAKEAHALSMPLIINKISGRKFGKSEQGSIWLDANKTTVYRFYHFWFNTSDEDVEDYLKIFTLLSKDEIEKFVSAQKNNPADRPAQRSLAYEVTKIVHGTDQAKKQEHIARVLFGGGDISSLDDAEIATIREEIPGKKVHPGSSVIEVLVESGLASSNSEARRLLESKAIYVNGQKLQNPHLDSSDFRNGRILLRRGKAYKDSALIELA